MGGARTSLEQSVSMRLPTMRVEAVTARLNARNVVVTIRIKYLL